MHDANVILKDKTIYIILERTLYNDDLYSAFFIFSLIFLLLFFKFFNNIKLNT